MLTFDWPISSPQMMTMLGFVACAVASTGTTAPTARNAASSKMTLIPPSMGDTYGAHRVRTHLGLLLGPPAVFRPRTLVRFERIALASRPADDQPCGSGETPHHMYGKWEMRSTRSDLRHRRRGRSVILRSFSGILRIVPAAGFRRFGPQESIRARHTSLDASFAMSAVGAGLIAIWHQGQHPPGDE